MKAINDFIDCCSDWLLGNIQTQIIKIVFPIVLGFQIANWWTIPPIFSVYSDVMDKVWWVDFIVTFIALVNYACRKPREFLEHING